uniref:Uncharacterized protein n=1 Tax=Brassica campestris TaxID=3711 RepID=M4DLF7_BRACM
MFKQILGKLPKKPSSAKFWDNGESQAPDNSHHQGDDEVRSQSSSNGDCVSVEVLPRLKDVSISEKLRLCCVVFDFAAEPQVNLKEKEIKRQTLLEYVISSGNAKFPESVIQEAVEIVSANLFFFFLIGFGRSRRRIFEPFLASLADCLRVPSKTRVASPNTDAKISKKYIDPTFVLNLLHLFDSEDQKERETERALYLWNNDHVSDLVRQNSRIILPIVFPALEKNGSSHWNQTVKNLTENVLKVLSDTNPECSRKFQEDQQNEEDTKKKNGETWRQQEEIVIKWLSNSFFLHFLIFFFFFFAGLYA